MWKPIGRGNPDPEGGTWVGPENRTPAEGSNRLAGSMKKEESQLVAVEDFYW